MTRLLEEVLKKQGISYRADVSTAALCSFRIGGVARIVIEPACFTELIRAVELCDQTGIPCVVIGKGSNILFDDHPLELVLIRTVKLDAIRVLRNGRILAYCGASLPMLSVRAANMGLGGLTWATGIPGTVGGAAWMNAGAHGMSMENIVENVEIFDRKERKIKTLFHQELGFSYRNSNFQSNNDLILTVTMQLEPNADPQALQQEMRQHQQWRAASQPLELPSAGSSLRRPSPGQPLAPILDELEIKGMTVGGASVSHKHAGFIVNHGGATAADVRALISQIQNIVERERGFRPIPEICMIPQKHHELFADTEK